MVKTTDPEYKRLITYLAQRGKIASQKVHGPKELAILLKLCNISLLNDLTKIIEEKRLTR